jgi:hypothetical protein
MAFPDRPKELDAIHGRHIDIAEDEREALAIEAIERLESIGGGGTIVA